MTDKQSNPPLNIAIAIYQHLLITSLTLPIEMLRAGEAFAKGHINKQNFRPLAIHLVAKNLEPISNRTGLRHQQYPKLRFSNSARYLAKPAPSCTH